jgi:hypothetical protein
VKPVWPERNVLLIWETGTGSEVGAEMARLVLEHKELTIGRITDSGISEYKALKEALLKLRMLGKRGWIELQQASQR